MMEAENVKSGIDLSGGVRIIGEGYDVGDVHADIIAYKELADCGEL